MRADNEPLDNTGKRNGYRCDACGHQIVTVDRAPGVTPFMVGCEKCLKHMHSGFYHATFQKMEPTHEWYKPDAEELASLGETMREWVETGHLLLRKIGGDLHQDFDEAAQ